MAQGCWPVVAVATSGVSCDCATSYCTVGDNRGAHWGAMVEWSQGMQKRPKIGQKVDSDRNHTKPKWKKGGDPSSEDPPGVSDCARATSSKKAHKCLDASVLPREIVLPHDLHLGGRCPPKLASALAEQAVRTARCGNRDALVTSPEEAQALHLAQR